MIIFNPGDSIVIEVEDQKKTIRTDYDIQYLIDKINQSAKESGFQVLHVTTKKN